MAIWYHAGTHWQKTYMARSRFGASAFLCCPGPSLRNVDPTAIQGPGAFVLAVNTAYPYVRPDAWIGMDEPQEFAPTLWHEPFPKFCRGGYQGKMGPGAPLWSYPATYFLDLQPADASEMFRRRGHDVKFVWAGDTLTPALHLLVWLGFWCIYLVGTDFGGADDYHDIAHRISAPQRARNRRLYEQQVKRIAKLAPLADACDIEIISCTPDSPVNNHVRYMPLTEAIAFARPQLETYPCLNPSHNSGPKRLRISKSA